MSQKADDFAAMLDLVNPEDPESAHQLADNILLAFLDANGDGKVADAYRALKARSAWWACA
jgi:hypothetical protein